MKNAYRTLALTLTAAALALSLTGCSKDLRDVKVSELTMEQQKEIAKDLKPAELENVRQYFMYRKLNNYKDLSINEVLKVGDADFPVAD